jgi:hypothetical protein
MFFDEGSIEIGDRWPDTLKEALRVSKCMVCVWSPPYFQSSWCVSEWQSFLARERRLNLQSHGLVAPLRFHDGEHFPEEAQAVQWTDVEPFAYTLPAFWESRRVVRLEARMKEFAKGVARMIRDAPQFEADWPVIDARGHMPPKIGLSRL